MSALLDAFNAIKTQVETVTDVKTVRLFNSQIDNEERENPFKYPAVFIEFQEILWNKAIRNVKTGEATITLHIAVESYKTETESLPAVLALAAKIHVAIDGFGGGCFTEFALQAERQDTDHDNCIVWQIDYQTELTEGASDPRERQISTPSAPDLSTSGVLDIDSIVIRTGDGDFS